MKILLTIRSLVKQLFSFLIEIIISFIVLLLLNNFFMIVIDNLTVLQLINNLSFYFKDFTNLLIHLHFNLIYFALR